MLTIKVTDARKRWSELVLRAEAGEQIVITRRSKAAGLLIPPGELRNINNKLSNRSSTPTVESQ